jgi:hypothetical protein
MSVPGAPIRAMPGDLERLPAPVFPAGPGVGPAAVAGELLARVWAALPILSRPHSTQDSDINPRSVSGVAALRSSKVWYKSVAGFATSVVNSWWLISTRIAHSANQMTPVEAGVEHLADEPACS